jgi:hypothetical protein
MAWNLGLLGASSEAPPGTFELLESQILTGSAATVQFTSLNSAYSSTYRHLQFRVAFSPTNDAQMTWIRFNSDSGTNYARRFLTSYDGAGIRTGVDLSQTLIQYYYAASAYGFPAVYGGIMDISDAFSTSKNKMVRITGDRFAPNESGVTLQSAHWRSLSALDSVLFDCGDASFASGSRFSLYGIRTVNA